MLFRILLLLLSIAAIGQDECEEKLTLSPHWIEQDQELDAWRFDKNLLQTHLMSVKDGLLCYADTDLKLVPGLYTFVIGLDLNIYAVHTDPRIFSRFYTNSRPTFHSSFFGELPILGAGEFRINTLGAVDYINDGSGHFKPSIYHLIKAIKLFKKKGILFDPQSKVSIHLPGSPLEKSVEFPLNFLDSESPQGHDPIKFFENLIRQSSDLLEDPQYGLDYARSLLWLTSYSTDKLLQQAVNKHGKKILKDSHLDTLSYFLDETETAELFILHHPEGNQLIINKFKQERASILKIKNDFLRSRALSVMNRRIRAISKIQSIPLVKRAWYITNAH